MSTRAEWAPEDREALASLIDLVARRVGDVVLERLTRGEARYVSQFNTQLGPRKHREAVKRRIDREEGGAFISPDGRRFLLTQQAHEAELARSRGYDGPLGPGLRKASKREKGAELSDFERRVLDIVEGPRKPRQGK
jgi:hypothetical protein